MDNMSNSAGNAEKEMDTIRQSLDFKINEFKQTGVGIAQNLFQREDMGALVEGLTSVLNVIDKITEELGLIGTIGVGAGIIAFFKNLDSLKNIGNITSGLGGIANVIQTLNGFSATSLSGLTGVFSIFQKMNEVDKATTALRNVSVLMKTFDGSDAAIRAVADSLDGITLESASAILGLTNLNDVQLAAILSAAGLTDAEAANAAATIVAGQAAQGASNKFTILGKSMLSAGKGLLTFLTTNPVGWAILAGTAIFGVVKAFKKAEEAAEESRKKTLEAADSFNEQYGSLNDYADKIRELREKLDSGTLSEAEAYEAKKNLLSIQNELKQSYGDNAAAIDLLNGKIENQIGLVKQLSVEDANKYLNDNAKDIAKAEKELTKTLGGDGSWWSYGGEQLGTFYETENSDKIMEILDKYKDYIEFFENGDGSYTVQFYGNAEEAEEVMNNLRTDLRNFEEEYGENPISSEMFTNAGNIESEANKILDDWQLIFDTAKQSRMITEAYGDNAVTYDYGDKNESALMWLEDYTNAIKKYNDALLEGNPEKISAAKSEFEALDTAINALLKNEDFAQYKEMFEEVRAQLDETSAAAQNFSEELESKSLKDYVEQIKALNMTDIQFSEKFLEGLGEDEISKAIQNIIDAYSELFGLDAGDITQEQIESIASSLVENGVLIKDVSEEASDVAKDAKMSFHDLMASADIDGEDTSKFTEELDKYVDKINSLKDALEKYRTGKLTNSDLYDLIKTFPDLADHTDDLDDAILQLIDDIVNSKDDSGLAGFFDKYMDMMDTDESRQKLADFYNDVMRLIGTDGKLTLTVDFDVEKENFTSLYNAMQESVSGTGLETSSIENIQKIFSGLSSYNPTKLFESTANGVHLNADAVRDLQDEYEGLKKQEISSEIDRVAQAYSEAVDELYRLNAAGEDTTAQQGVVDGLGKQLTEVQLLQAQYDGLTSAYNKWIMAQSGGNERDSLEAVAKGYDSMQDILDRGWYGDKSLNEYLDLMLSASQRTGDAEADFAKLTQTIEGTSHSLKDYFTFDDDGNFTEQGIDMFLNDVNQALGDGYAKIDENGEWVFDATGDKLQEIADRFGTSTEMVELFARAMQDAGMHVEFDKNLDGLDVLNKDIDSAKAKIQELQKAGKISPSIDLNFDTASMGVSDLKDKIEELNGERAEINVEENPEAAAALDDLINKCERQYFIKLNAETDGSLDEASYIIDQLQAKVSEGNHTLTYEAKVRNEQDVTNLAEELANLPSETQIAVGVTTENVGSAQGIVNQLKENPESISVPVNYIPGEIMEEKEYKDQKPTVNYKVNAPKEPKYKNQYPVVTYKMNAPSEPTYKNIDRTITYTYKTSGTPPKQGEALGTAHVSGTANSSFGGRWSAAVPSVKAYVSGSAQDWALKQNEDALVNETGLSESIVRDGRWFMIPGGAHVEHLQKGDIVFNAAQTEELLKNGRVLSGGGHGRVALANGTAFSGMPAHGAKAKGKTKNWGNSSGGSSGGSSSGGSSGGSSKGGSNNSSKSTEKEKETIDWIEIALDRVQRKIEKFKTAAESTFKTFTTRNKNLANEISSVSSEITLQEKAYKRYQKEAKSVGLSDDLKKKVQNGTIKIEDYDDVTAEKIQNYQKWYEKSLDCKDAISELKNELSELGKQKFDMIVTKWNGKLLELQHTAEHITNIINRRSDTAGDYVKGTKSRELYSENITDYRTLIQNANDQIKKRKKERKELVKELNSGKYKEGTEAYNEMVSQINDVDNEIDGLQSNITEYTNSIYGESENIFNSLVSDWSNKLQDLQHESENTESSIERRNNYASDYVNIEEGRNAAQQNISDYQSLIKNAQEQVSVLEQKRQSLIDALNSSEIKEGTNAWYEMLGQIQDVDNEINAMNNNIITYSNNVSEQYKKIFDSYKTQYENEMNSIEHMSNEVNTALSKAEAQGRLASDSYYKELQALTEQQIQKLTEEREKLEEAFYSAISSGEIEVGSQAYYDMQNAIDGVTEKLQQAEVEVIELNNKIRQCKWDNFDFLEERISRLSSEAEFLIDLMSDENLYEDNGQLNDKGMASMGLHAVNYNVLMSQADDYAEQIEELNKLIAEDPADTNLLKRRDEMIDAQQQAILKANEEKQAIKSLVEEGIQIEIDSLKDLVDKYKDALDSAKD